MTFMYIYMFLITLNSSFMLYLISTGLYDNIIIWPTFIITSILLIVECSLCIFDFGNAE